VGKGKKTAKKPKNEHRGFLDAAALDRKARAPARSPSWERGEGGGRGQSEEGARIGEQKRGLEGSAAFEKHIARS